MKILLINPETKFPGKVPSIPLGLLQVAALPEKEGNDVEILDCNKLPIDRVKKKIKKSDPDVIGLTGWTGKSLKSCVEISKFSKENTQAKVVWGGVHSSLLPYQVIREDYVDFVVAGEGDLIFSDLINNLKNPKRVKGIVFKDDGKIRSNLPGKPVKNLDSLSPIPWDIIDVKDYTFKWIGGFRTMALPTSRGCPYDCNFCYNKVFYCEGWRPYSLKRVRENLENLLNSYPKIEALKVDYEDNLIGSDPDRAIQLSRLFKGHDLRWGCQFRVSNVNKKMLKEFKKNDCEYIFFGVESGSQRMLDFLNKRTSVKQIIDVFDFSNEIGLRSVASFMLDIPTETRKDLSQTAKLARRLKSVLYAGFYQPYPETSLYNFLVKNGFSEPKSTEDWIEFDFSRNHNFSGVSNTELRFTYYYLNYILNTQTLLQKGDYEMFVTLLKTVLRI